MAKPKTLRLILGDQLNEGHSWFQRPRKDVVYALMEMRQETDYVVHHIQKMSDYCAACRYSPTARVGERACPFNNLYWDFLHRHRSRLKKNPRVGMMYRTWDRMADATRRDLLAQAAAYRADLNNL